MPKPGYPRMVRCRHCRELLQVFSGVQKAHPVCRFWSLVKKAGPDECWVWTGGTIHHGYGQIKWEGENRLAHCVAWEITNKSQIRDEYVLHSCDNPPCCNPAHLRTGNQVDNMADRMARGRY